jgi:hypothetical protein
MTQILKLQAMLDGRSAKNAHTVTESTLSWYASCQGGPPPQ